MMAVIRLTVRARFLLEDGGFFDCSLERRPAMTVQSMAKGVTTMKKFMLVAAIASLPLVNAGAVWAQAAVGEPGLAAFNHPDADILHAGPGYSGYRAEPRNALASVPVARPARGHRHARSR
jgi:hypothetical protein